MKIQLTESQVERLERVAAREGVSMAELIRNGVEDLLTARLPVEREALRQLALAAIGRFRSGTDDLGSAHERYSEEAVCR